MTARDTAPTHLSQLYCHTLIPRAAHYKLSRVVEIAKTDFIASLQLC